jgi:hypothetical protein
VPLAIIDSENLINVGQAVSKKIEILLSRRSKLISLS